MSRELFDAMKQGGVQIPAEAEKLLAPYEGKTVAADKLAKLAGHNIKVALNISNSYITRHTLQRHMSITCTARYDCTSHRYSDLRKFRTAC